MEYSIRPKIVYSTVLRPIEAVDRARRAAHSCCEANSEVRALHYRHTVMLPLVYEISYVTKNDIDRSFRSNIEKVAHV